MLTKDEYLKYYYNTISSNPYSFPLDKVLLFPMAYLPQFLLFTKWDLNAENTRTNKTYVQVAKDIIAYIRSGLNEETFVKINNKVHKMLPYRSDKVEAYNDYLYDETAGDCEDRVFFILRALNTVKKEIDTSWMRQRIDINIHHNLNKYIFAHAACKYVDDDNNVELHCILVIFGPTRNYVLDPSIYIENSNFGDFMYHSGLTKKIDSITQLVINNTIYDCNIKFNKKFQYVKATGTHFTSFETKYLKEVKQDIKPIKEYLDLKMHSENDEIAYLFEEIIKQIKA